LTQPFELGVYEVTQEQYEKVMGTNPSKFKGPQNPVETVSWQDAETSPGHRRSRIQRHRTASPGIPRSQPASGLRCQPELCQQAAGVTAQDGFAEVESTDRNNVGMT
jgi:hypothetical protein